MTQSLTVTGALIDGALGGVRCVDGVITQLGDGVFALPGDEQIDAGGLSLIAPLVNGHTHAAMTLLRGYGDDLALMEWLETRIWPAESRLTPENVYWGTRLAALEMIRSGTLRFWDMYFDSTEVARAVSDSGMRACVSQVVINAPGTPATAKPEASEDGLLALMESTDLITPALGPHSIYTLGREDLEHISALSAKHNVAIHMHLSETAGEVANCIDANKVRPVHYLDALGLVNERSVFAHSIFLDDTELAVITERGATLVTCPASNMKLASGGPFRYSHARRHGCSVGIGTDGASSNNSLDLFQDIKLLSLLQKHSDGDPSVLPAREALSLASGALAPRLGATPLAVGEQADFLLIDLDSIELTPAPLAEALIYSATGSCVDTAVVAGRVLMRARMIDGADEVLAKAREAAKSVRITN